MLRMKRIILKSPRTFAVEEVPVPKPGLGEALVRVKKVGVCGSDIHLYRHGKIGEIKMTGPLVIGHECAGVVDAVGHGVDDGLVGKRVAVEPQIFCGKCRWCVTGNQNLCPTHLFLGLPPKDGAMQEYIAHPAHLLEPLPDSISDDAAVALEPLSIARHAVNLAKIRPGQSVVILGTGVLGTCVLMLLGLYRGLKVVCVDALPKRLERARQMGASETVLARTGEAKRAAGDAVAATGGLGADVVFECAGVEDTLHNMCEVAGPGGHVAIIGSNPEDKVEFSSGTARRKGLTLRFVRRSLNTLGDVMHLTEDGLVRPGDIVTHTFGAHQSREAFDLVDKYGDGVLKAIIDMEKWNG